MCEIIDKVSIKYRQMGDRKLQLIDIMRLTSSEINDKMLIEWAIKRAKTENISKRYAKYVPFWG